MTTPCVSAAQSVAKVEKVVLFALDSVTWEDINAARTPNIKKLAAMGAAGVMNTRTSGPETTEKCYLTIGAGFRADAPESARKARGRAGEPSMLSVFVPTPWEIQKLNKRNSVDYKLLGDYLSENGIKSAVIGNADTALPLGPSSSGDAFHREIALVAANSRGEVPVGAIGLETVAPDPAASYGVRANNMRMAELFVQAYKANNFIAVMHGDTFRAVSKKNAPRDAVSTALERADILLGFIMSFADMSRTIIIFVVPSGPNVANAPLPEQLTPIIIAGPGVPHGLLSSYTTRTPGLVANMDIAPTILDMFGIEKTGHFQGQSIYYIPSTGDNIAKVSALARQSRSAYDFKTLGLSVFSLLNLLVIALAAYSGITRRANLNFLLKFTVRSLTIILLVYPACCMLLPMIAPAGTGQGANLAITYCVAIGFFIILSGMALKVPDYALILSLPVVPCFIIYDIANKLGMGQMSLFGQSLIIGKRFYGIGNEHMALFAAGLTMGAALLAEHKQWSKRRRNLGLFFILAPAILIMGYPGLGANAGGALTLVAALVVTSALAENGRLRWKHAAYGIVAAVLFHSLFILSDRLVNPGHPTHIAGSAMLIKEQGWEYLRRMLQQKISIQVHVLIDTIWPVVFFAIIGLFGWLYRRPGNRVKLLISENQALRAGVGGNLAAAIAGYVFNDSGIVVSVLILGVTALSICWFLACPSPAPEPNPEKA